MLASKSHSILPKPKVDAPSHTPVLARCGEYWTVQFHGRTFCVRNSKGIEDLARLIDAPAVKLHVLELFQDQRARRALPKAEGSVYVDGLHIARGAGAWDEPIDPRARAAYRERWAQLTEELEEAHERNDMGRVERYQTELSSLEEQLAQRRYVGCSATEHARKAVYNRLHAAIRRLAQLDRELGAHLQRAIKTGIHCYYRPELVRCISCAK